MFSTTVNFILYRGNLDYFSDVLYLLSRCSRYRYPPKPLTKIFFYFFPTICVLSSLSCHTLRFYAGGGFPIVAVPCGCSLGGYAIGILYHHENFTTPTFTPSLIHHHVLKLSLHIAPVNQLLVSAFSTFTAMSVPFSFPSSSQHYHICRRRLGH